MFTFSKEEKQVILFLVIITMVGMAISFLVKKYSGVKIISNLSQDIGKVNLNQADKDTLKSVGGIGEKLAQRILEYRKLQGGFQEVEELRNIKGITKSRYEKIKDEFLIR